MTFLTFKSTDKTILRWDRDILGDVRREGLVMDTERKVLIDPILLLFLQVEQFSSEFINNLGIG